jgi:hypothetical protein
MKYFLQTVGTPASPQVGPGYSGATSLQLARMDASGNLVPFSSAPGAFIQNPVVNTILADVYSAGRPCIAMLPGYVLTISYGGTLFQSTDGGATFANMSQALPNVVPSTTNITTDPLLLGSPYWDGEGNAVT